MKACTADCLHPLKLLSANRPTCTSWNSVLSSLQAGFLFASLPPISLLAAFVLFFFLLHSLCWFILTTAQRSSSLDPKLLVPQSLSIVWPSGLQLYCFGLLSLLSQRFVQLPQTAPFSPMKNLVFTCMCRVFQSPTSYMLSWLYNKSQSATHLQTQETLHGSPKQDTNRLTNRPLCE